jgi:cell division protein FtsZ
LTSVRLVEATTGTTTRPMAVAFGIGGGGSDLLAHLMDLDLEGLHCIAVDNDRYALHIARAHSKLLIEHSADEGVQEDIEIARELSRKTDRELQSLVGQPEIAFMMAGMGGRTGGRAAPIIAEIARKNGAIVIGLVTKPFLFEQGRLHTAVNSIRRLTNACDTVILIDNYASDPFTMTLPFNLSLDTAGQTCCAIVQSLMHTFADSRLGNGELGELRTMLRRGGLAKAGIGQSHSHLGAEEAALKAFRNTMAQCDLSKANGVFVNITGGNHVQQKHVESAIQLFSMNINPSVQFLYGHRLDASMRGATRVTLLATGVSFPSAWGRYRKVPLELYDLEPESAEEEDLSLKLGLVQMEDITN